MKVLRILGLAMVLVLGFSTASIYAEDKVTGSASVGVFNRYIFRGYELSSKSVVVQPAVTVSFHEALTETQTGGQSRCCMA